MTKQSKPDQKSVTRPTGLLLMQSAGYATIVAIGVLLVSLPVLGRSPWLDEIMLFNNYPISDISALFSPLAYYDQAATPLYSLLASWVADYDISTTRSALVFFIAFALAWCLVIRHPAWDTTILTLITVCIFLRPLLMYSECKHYGLEAVGALLLLTWFVFKNPNDRLTVSDIVALTSGLIFGISTLIVAGVSLFVFLAYRYHLTKKLSREELVLSVFFIAFTLCYYILIKDITQFQIGNYIDAYRDRGIWMNARLLIQATISQLDQQGVYAIAAAFVLLALNFSDSRSQRLVLVSFCTAMAFLIVAGLGLYPAKGSRQLTWVAGFLYALTFYGVYLAYCRKGFIKLAAVIVFLGLALIAAKNTLSLYKGNFEKTENNQSISWIRNLPPSSIGLWIGGQPVIEYYSDIYPDLAKHSYFGSVNIKSGKVDHNELLREESFNFAQIKDAPGAWGKLMMLRLSGDYKAPASVFVADAPREEEFYIFASHYHFHAPRGWPKSRVDGLHAALSDSDCGFDVIKQFKGVSIYKALCPGKLETHVAPKSSY